jgi:hypothetical protein
MSLLDVGLSKRLKTVIVLVLSNFGQIASVPLFEV